MSKPNPAALGFEPGRLSALRDAVAADVAAGRYDGAAMLVARRGEIAFDEVVGFADRAADRPLGREDVFFTMSVAKQFTNTAVLQVVERGRLALTTRVAEIIPEFAAHGKDRVTVGDLVIHKAGLSAGFPPLPPEQAGNLSAVALAVAAMPPEAEPGTVINYSPVCAHAVLGEMVRRVDPASRPFRRILAEDVFEPLGMTDTSVGVRPDLAPRRVPVVVRDRSPGLFEPEALEGISAILTEESEVPAGGCLTTASDLLRFAEAMRLGGALDGHRILSPAMLRLATTNQTGEMPNLLWAYAKEKAGWPDIPAYLGMGFFLRGRGLFPMPFGSLASPGTFGGLGAGSTMFWVDPASETSFVFLSSGLLEESANVVRLQRISDMVHAALVH